MHPGDLLLRDPRNQTADEGVIKKVGSRIICMVAPLCSPAGSVDCLGESGGTAHELDEGPGSGGGRGTLAVGARRRVPDAFAACSLADGVAVLAR